MTVASPPVIEVFGEHEAKVREQLERCVSAAEGARGVLCADGHYGYSQPIGGAVAYPHHISPSGVGYDIACGNKAVRTDISAGDVDEELPAVMDEIVDRISFGMGRSNREPVADSAVLDAIREAPFAPQRQLYDLAAKQLGTVGAGNHYVDLFADERERVWIGVHFGSRGFGHKTATGFLSLAAGGKFEERASEGEMHSPPVLLDTRTDLGQAYIEAMKLAGDYAYAGRDWVTEKVLSILGADAVEEIHNHHNFAWREVHFGQQFWVIRKGCTPAFPGQQGFVGATMGDESVILEGVESEASKTALYSTVHGAGRVMSRIQAAGKTKRRKVDGQWRREVKSPGVVDWSSVTASLAARGIELRGGAADEAPEVYKRLTDVLDAHEGTIRVLHRLRPLGVAMAGGDTYDPFKD